MVMEQNPEMQKIQKYKNKIQKLYKKYKYLKNE